MPLIDNAIYRDGRRVQTPHTLEETFELNRAEGGMAWIGLYRPTDAELAAVAEEFSLHELAVEDASTGHQRAKLERYDDVLFVALRPARYIDSAEEVEFGELHVFVGPDFVVTVRHAETPDLAQVRKRLEADPELLARGPEAVLYAILDQVVDEYEPVVAGLENDIDEIEDQLFGEDDDETLARRIYDLSREVISFQRAVHPLVGMLDALLRGGVRYGVDVELQRSLRDVLDHVTRTVERADSYRALLASALQVQSTLVTRAMTRTTIQQNEQIKRITSWAAILFAPTLVGTVYGMNFRYMPELLWTWGYPFALLLMLLLGLGLYVVFKIKRWL
ncbi:magnesium/cobalt transporter CorA [Protaetiibacter larvae]|uniref:Magnesium transport protein CorA n=1 Tax=Protaetiibacter larvae TaxID=2592654 RepID=A0A5C1Y6V1_9MICO|nr:magnesium/cobalt transporter CorA [Protaetiibacter larvae]QEO09168.1 magnesium/cobalt transporter CorA [Protaetiibacter larvae]